MGTGIGLVPAAAVAALASAMLALAPPAPAAAQPNTKLMVLRLADVPAGFARESAHAISNAESSRTSTPHRNYARLGRVAGYSATYTKDGVTGLLQIESDANLYRTTRQAHHAFLLGVTTIEHQQAGLFERLSVGGKVGQEVRLYKATRTQNGTRVDVFALAWRSGRVISTLLGAGLAGTVDPADVVALGRRQQARIAAAT